MSSRQRYDDSPEVIDQIAPGYRVSPHPRALQAFSIARFFERVAFYSMRHWLILYFMGMMDGEKPLDEAYTNFQYIILAFVLSQIPGAIAVDLGYKRRHAVVWGGALLAVGYFSLALLPYGLSWISLLACCLGFGLYSAPSITSMASFYRGREAYLEAGMSYYFGMLSAAALITSFLLGIGLRSLDWQRGAMVAGITMMLGHVYLLAVARVFREKKLPQAAAARPESRRSTFWLSSVAFGVLLSYLAYSYFTQEASGFLRMLSMGRGELGIFGQTSQLVSLALTSLALFASSWWITRHGASTMLRLGLGLLLGAVAGALLPGVLPAVADGLPSASIYLIAAGLTVMIVVAEVLTLPAVFSVVLHLPVKWKNTLIAALSSISFLPLLMLGSDLSVWQKLLFGGLGIAAISLMAIWAIKHRRQSLY